jgi:hypothetical protein
MIVNIIEFFRARLKATIRVCLVVLAALVVWDALFVSKEHVHTFVERIPGFWAAFRLLSPAL